MVVDNQPSTAERSGAQVAATTARIGTGLARVMSPSDAGMAEVVDMTEVAESNTGSAEPVAEAPRPEEEAEPTGSTNQLTVRNLMQATYRYARGKVSGVNAEERRALMRESLLRAVCLQGEEMIFRM